MSASSSIEWTDASWNCVTGCHWVSPGCDNCYARTLAKRLKAMGNPRYQADGYDRALKAETPGFGVTLHYDQLDLPLRWRKPRRVFVNSMSDAFHDDVPEGLLAQMFAVMACTQRHTFQLLTKRPRRMLTLLSSTRFQKSVAAWTEQLVEDDDEAPYRITHAWTSWPLPNVWLGTSVEDQTWAARRVPLLLRTPAAVRFLSCEPLLGPIDLRNLRAINGALIDCLAGDVKSSDGREVYAAAPGCIDWVIVGGESGPGARPVDPAWVHSLRDQCVAGHRSFFFNQWGGRTPKAGGRDLDGRTWDEMPAEARA